MASILVVDDVVSTTKIVEQLLSVKGHQVICAVSGKEALKIIESKPIDLVITDIVMPEMDGYELIRELHKQSDPPKIIAMSGGSDTLDGEGLLHVAELMRVDRILLKPIESASINAAVMEVLGAESTT